MIIVFDYPHVLSDSDLSTLNLQNTKEKKNFCLPNTITADLLERIDLTDFYCHYSTVTMGIQIQ